MAIIKPFRALRPKPELASRICELPYDVLSSEEARQIASGNRLSFLHVSKPEIDLPPGAGLYSPEAYATAKKNFERLRTEGALRQDELPLFYFYRQALRRHQQVGLAAAASCQEYLDQTIKRHELTRPDKEQDRMRHIEALEAQTGPAFLAYRADATVDAIAGRVCAQSPEIDFIAADGIRHSAWPVRDRAMIADIERAFRKIPALYIADGHHRTAAAARISEKRRGAGGSDFFLAVIFPHNQLQILPYNRALRDLNGRRPDQALAELDQIAERQPGTGALPDEKHQIGFYLSGQWWRLRFRSNLICGANALEQLDVALLQKYLLEPIFGIDDPRTSERISFVGGIRGTAELAKRVDSGEFACAFSMFPTGIEELMAVADAGGIMPPKSTWFEPKLRDGLFCHLL